MAAAPFGRPRPVALVCAHTSGSMCARYRFLPLRQARLPEPQRRSGAQSDVDPGVFEKTIPHDDHAPCGPCGSLSGRVRRPAQISRTRRRARARSARCPGPPELHQPNVGTSMFRSGFGADSDAWRSCDRAEASAQLLLTDPAPRRRPRGSLTRPHLWAAGERPSGEHENPWPRSAAHLAACDRTDTSSYPSATHGHRCYCRCRHLAAPRLDPRMCAPVHVRHNPRAVPCGRRRRPRCERRVGDDPRHRVRSVPRRG